MTKLDLTANGTEQKMILDYLQENASEILADKINKGVKIVKDGTELINKKTLDGFMKYASEQAKAGAVKGANVACVASDTVFGWAIHYFEEDTIEGTLLNEDGTEYKPAKVVGAKTTVKASAKPAENILKSTQIGAKEMSMFEMMDEQKLDDFEEIKPRFTGPDEHGIVEEIVPSPHKEIAPKQKNIVPKFLFELFGDTLKIEVCG